MSATMFGAPLSLYSGKARSYLDWKGVDYTEVLATPDIHQSEIVPAVGRPVIPVVKLEDGTILQDTTVIIDHFEAASEGPSVYPQTPRQLLAALLLETYGDEWLVIPAMHYRWNYNEQWVYGEFGKVALPDGTPDEQREAGMKRGAAFKGFVPVLGINEATIPAIEASYEALLRDLDTHFAKHPFLFGSRPSIGDYGLIGPLYAHNYRDPASGEIMKRIAPRVAEWVERMIAPEPLSGDFLGGDEIPDTLVPVLHRMMTEQLPHLETVAQMLGEWAKANGPYAELPRALGMAGFTIEGTEGERIAAPFSLWMLQRALDYLSSLEGDDRAACETMLHDCGGDALIGFVMPVRLVFENHKLRVEAG
ncbi:glutathione S-transferase [Erythrobacter sp. NAP1]|uniref:glutathione S-transferase family protein n=1 Tax=Erythrobacter sp. NAP1 TaxID=237727 RepID=UPI000068778C|nr:glutathione S-transferase family protein [Erythrobacter sp. NAP1]EAQ28747.1 glutathione S-transferase [Erythrobacter sp. NAP1]